MENKIDVLETKYSSLIPTYNNALAKIETLINDLLTLEKIQIHAVQERVKSVESFLQKATSYENPFLEITDYIVLRIICYIPSDVERVCSLIEDNFCIDRKNSVNKTSSLGIDKVGYESIHFIAKLNSVRSGLPEFSFMKDFCFEIQIRTLLQHTWAEIEHDKNYKFSGTLPDSIKRRFNILSGTLELIDREFDNLSSEIDHYKKQVKQNLKDKKYDIEITTESLIEYFTEKKEFDLLTKKSLDVFTKFSSEIIQEMSDFGIKTLKDFIELENSISKESLLFRKEGNTIPGYVRNCMILNDANKYFAKSWKMHWTEADEYLKQYLSTQGINFYALVRKKNKRGRL